MEATPSAILINNLSIPIRLDIKIIFNLFVYTVVITSAVTTTGKVLSMIFDQLTKIFYYIWVKKFEDKKTLAIDVIRICTEGSSSSWRDQPRDQEHLIFIQNLLENTDKKASELFNECISAWRTGAVPNYSMVSPLANDPEHLELMYSFRDRAEKASKELLKIVNRWR